MKFVGPGDRAPGPADRGRGLGAFFLFVYRFFFGGEVSFKQSLAIVAWVVLALASVSIPLMLAVYAAKGDWNIDPTRGAASQPLAAPRQGPGCQCSTRLAESIDLFSFWTLFLLASGFAVLIRKPPRRRCGACSSPGRLWCWQAGLPALMS